MSVNQVAVAHVHKLAREFELEEIDGSRSEDVYFVEGEQAILARQLGRVFWLPPKHAYRIFLYSYTALFGIPVFTAEAVNRQPDRFTRKLLPSTVRTTSAFILDAFGYDLRMDRPRDVLYRPSPAIRAAHGQRKSKQRISNAPMAYFAYNLVRAAEQLSSSQTQPHFERQRREHYDYFGTFLRAADYPFPHNRAKAEAFSMTVDESLADTTYTAYWHNILATAEIMGVCVTRDELINFLPPRSSRIFAEATG